MVGGIALSVLIVMTCISIAGRALNGFGFAPIPGDFEIVEAGIAFAVFCFIPYCQVNSGHATVDVFTVGLGKSFNRILVAFWEVIFAAVLIFIAWRLFEGMQGKMRYGETSMFLQFPIWWPYVACLIAACISVVVGIWSAYDRVWAIVLGRDTRPIA